MAISILTVLLFILVPPLIINFTIFPSQQNGLYYGLIFVLLFTVAATDLLKIKQKTLSKTRTIAVWLLIILTIGIGFFIYINDRHKISPAYRTHDIVIQQEVAVRMLLTGKNPYKETYHGTPLEEFKYSETEENPALYHFVMEPFYLLSAIPFYVAQSRLFGFFDARVPLYILFSVMLLLGFRFIKDRENKLLFITLMAFNPMTVGFLLEGRSDMYMFPFLFASFILLHKQKFALASLFAGLAFAIKQVSWPLFPLFIYYIYLKTKDLKQTMKYSLVSILAALLFAAPFFAWDPKSFLDSTVFYLSGQALHSYPVSGYGFSQLLLDLGYIKNANSYYPFIIWQIIFALPVLFVLIKQLKRSPNTKTLISCYAIFLFIFWYFSRYFNNSHIGFISTVLITAYFFPEDKRS